MIVVGLRWWRNEIEFVMRTTCVFTCRRLLSRARRQLPLRPEAEDVARETPRTPMRPREPRTYVSCRYFSIFIFINLYKHMTDYSQVPHARSTEQWMYDNVKTLPTVDSCVYIYRVVAETDRCSCARQNWNQKKILQEIIVWLMRSAAQIVLRCCWVSKYGCAGMELNNSWICTRQRFI